jgi:hypothetical protein
LASRSSAGSFFVAAREQKRLGVDLAIEDSDQPDFLSIRAAGQAVDPGGVRLEESPEAIVFGLRNRVVLVVVAPGAVERQPQKRLRGVFDR